MTDEERTVFETALHRYGFRHQQQKLLEEMAELQKEICKHWDGAKNLFEIADEMADLEICLDQMKLGFQNGGLVQQRKQFKTERLLCRMQGEENTERAGFAESPDDRRWISVAERLPEPYETVLISVLTTNGFEEPVRLETLGALEGGKMMPYVLIRCYLHPGEQITHWMPLPAPPKEES